MSTDLHSIKIGDSAYVGWGRGAVIDALEAHVSEVIQFYVCEDDLEDLCKCSFEEYLGDPEWRGDWRIEIETLANIIQTVKKDSDCTFELW